MKQARKTAIHRHKFLRPNLVKALSKAKANCKTYTKASTKVTKYPLTKDIVRQNKNSHARQTHTHLRISKLKPSTNQTFETRFNLYIRGSSHRREQQNIAKTEKTGSKVRSTLESRRLLLRMEIFVGFCMRPR